MTVTSRRLAARCRERFVTDPTVLTSAAAQTAPAPPTTVDTADIETAIPQENLDTAAT